MERILFKEEQRFRQWWIWLLLLGATSVAFVPLVYDIFLQSIFEKSHSKNPSDISALAINLLILSVIMGGLIYLFYAARLIVEVRSGGLYFRFPPFQFKWKVLKKEEIEKFEIRTYQPVWEFGGWGIKGSRKNKAYNVSGNVGLQLYLKNGDKILFGTREKNGFEHAMKKLCQEKQE